MKTGKREAGCMKVSRLNAPLYPELGAVATARDPLYQSYLVAGAGSEL